MAFEDDACVVVDLDVAATVELAVSAVVVVVDGASPSLFPSVDNDVVVCDDSLAGGSDDKDAAALVRGVSDLAFLLLFSLSFGISVGNENKFLLHISQLIAFSGA